MARKRGNKKKNVKPTTGGNSTFLSRLPREIKNNIYLLSGVPRNQVVQCFSGTRSSAVAQYAQIKSVRSLEHWDFEDEPADYWGPGRWGPRAGPAVWFTAHDFYWRRMEAIKRARPKNRRRWRRGFRPVIKVDPTPTNLALICSQARPEVEYLLYSMNTFFTYLDWIFPLSNTIKTRLSTSNQASIRRLVVLVPYSTIPCVRVNLDQEGFLPATMASLNKLCIVIAQPFILTADEKYAWHKLLAKKLLPYLTLGLGANTQVFVDANWEPAAIDAVKDVLGPDRCRFQNMALVDYMDIYSIEDQKAESIQKARF